MMKTLDREQMMEWIGKYMRFVNYSEDFNGEYGSPHGGIQVSGEAMDEYKGSVIYRYYSEDYKKYELGVLKSWENALNKRGWFSEWYDCGTVTIWKI